MRVCNKCGGSKEDGDFYARPRNTCKDCHKSSVRLRRLVNPAVRKYDRERAKTPARRAKSHAISDRWRQQHPDAYKAQTALNNAVRDGRIKKMPCEVCASSTSIHGHHKDYRRPLDVIWLCARCHHRLHTIFPEFEGANKGRGRTQ